MRSFISSFKPVIAAAIAVFFIEATIFALVRPAFIERANYLTWAFGKNEPFQKLIVHRKLAVLGETAGDIIQIGDSSGLHGIDPRIVEKYLGGLKYINLSCCANTGYQGYYDIANYALSRNRNIKAIVLYTALGVLPQTDDFKTGGNNPDEIYNAVSAVWSQFSPPSQSLRPWITDGLYSGRGYVYHSSAGSSPSNSIRDMLSSFSATQGWVHETDYRRTGHALTAYWKGACSGDTTLNISAVTNRHRYYKRSWFGPEEFVPFRTYERFAKLANRHGAKLFIVFQPFPCETLQGDTLSIMRDALQELRLVHPNVAVFPQALLEHWPRSKFVSREHLRVGQDVEASHRIGRFLESAYSIKSTPSLFDPTPLTPSTAGPLTQRDNTKRAALPTSRQEAPTNLISDGNVTDQWNKAGIDIIATDGPGTVLLREDSGIAHNLELYPKGFDAGVSYLFSIEIKPVAQRMMRVVLRDMSTPGKYGVIDCIPSRDTASRVGAIYDVGIDQLSGGWYRCWGSITLTDTQAAIGFTILSDRGVPSPGNGESGMLTRQLELRPGLRLPPATLAPDD